MTSSSTPEAAPPLAARARVEAAALHRLAADELSALPAGIGDVHAAIAGRVFGALGPLGAPVRVVHDAASLGAYPGRSRRTPGAVPRGGHAGGARGG